MRIYELTEAYQQIIDRIEDGEMDLNDTLESIEDALDLKLENTAKIIRTWDAESAAIKAEEDRLKKRRQTRENGAERLKQYIFENMQKVKKEKIEGELFTLRLQNNPSKVNILNDKTIPAHYLVEQNPTINKQAILEDLKNGIAVEGAELQKSKHLRIV